MIGVINMYGCRMVDERMYGSVGDGYMWGGGNRWPNDRLGEGYLYLRICEWGIMWNSGGSG